MSGGKKPVSARGLFRAMGKASAPALMLGDDGGIERADDGLPREKDDFYPTPPEPIRALLAMEAGHIERALSVGSRHSIPIWEPAAGDGALMRELAAAGFAVVGSDLVDRGAPVIGGVPVVIRDFFSFTPVDAASGVIITNPPFGLCTGPNAPFVAHALGTLGARYLALLLPMGWWGAADRAAIWARHTSSIVYGMRWRIDFTGQGAPPMLNAWFVWDAARPAVAPGHCVFACLDRHMDARQSGLFSDNSAASFLEPAL